MTTKNNKAFLPAKMGFLIVLLLFTTVDLPRSILAQGSDDSVINLNLRGVTLKSAIRILGQRLGRNIAVDPTVENRRLNFDLKSVTPEEALNAILETQNLSCQKLQGNIYFVTESTKLQKQTIIKNIPCRYADAIELQKVLTKMVISESGAVYADKRTNTLIIKESPEVISSIEQLVKELDRPTAQVYIQSEIVEVSSTNDTEIGVEWLWKDPHYDKVKGKVGTQFGLRRTSPNGPYYDNAGNLIGTGLPVGDGLAIGILHTRVDAVLHALAQDNKINLLSRPRLVTLDNQEAVIEVGDQVPYKVLSQYGITSYEFKDATIKLVVRPHIIDDEFINLEVEPKADFQNGVSPDGTPIIATRRAKTNVKVRNGQTIVIGGLMRDSKTTSESKVPVLGSIPIIGRLFKFSRTTKVKTELVVFITPRIIEDDMLDSFDYEKK